MFNPFKKKSEYIGTVAVSNTVNLPVMEPQPVSVEEFYEHIWYKTCTKVEVINLMNKRIADMDNRTV